MEPITNPPTPYLGPISESFSSGKLIRIQGFAPPQAQRFDINLVTNEAKDNIGLHLSVRLLEGYVARNSFEGGIWGEEQDKGDLLILPGQNFEVVIFADTTEYKIAINGRHFCEFSYRIPIKNISHLSIDGDVSISLISFEDVPQHAQVQAPQSAPPSAPPNFAAQGGPENFAPQGGPGNFVPQSGPGNFAPQGGPGNFAPQGGPGNFAPPGYGPQGPYGPPPGQFGPGPYGPPPPPGHEQKGESGLDSFLDSAQSVIQGAIASGMAEKLLSSLSSGGNNPQQQTQSQPQNQQYHQQQPNFQPTQPNQPQQQNQGGPDIIGSLGTLLTTLTTPPTAPQQQNQQYQQQPPQQNPQNQPDVLGSLGSLLGSLTTAPRNQQQQQQPQYQQPAPQPQQDTLGGLGSLLSSFTQPQQSQQPLHPTNVGGQGSVGGLGSVGSILTSLAGQVLQPQPQPRRVVLWDFSWIAVPSGSNTQNYICITLAVNLGSFPSFPTKKSIFFRPKSTKKIPKSVTTRMDTETKA